VGRQFIDNNAGRDETGARSDDRTNDAFFLVDGSIRYTFAGDSPLAGFRISLDVNNVFDRRVLTYGNVGATGPQFFPAATRHVFLGAVYTMR
jgi:outer membrane receptor protein involved in Fe transport